jgi:hypothetical protein
MKEKERVIKRMREGNRGGRRRKKHNKEGRETLIKNVLREEKRK